MSPERWQKIEAVFEAVVDLPSSERAEALVEKCGNDSDLRSEVERLLASADSAGEFIESPVWTDSSFLNTSAKKEISASLADNVGDGSRDGYLGRVIGAYRLTHEIGRGGMGAVYLAERADGEFFQRVAIKLIKRGMDSDFIIRRFRHERQILASFEHPYIARLLDGGTTPDGVPYFVMEYVEGQTFYTYSDNGRLGITERLKLFQKVCSAIDYAHGKQIIHRDIKPSNILINRNGSPKLLDFGIAKILDPNLVHESINPTASMLRMMTPDYASPEQVQGSDITPSSDIYSLGVLLYELLTGHRPYNFTGRALHEVSYVICNTMPKLPSQMLEDAETLLPLYAQGKSDFADARRTTVQKLRSALTGDLDNIIMKALCKEPSARYASASEFAKDITRHLTGGRIHAPKYDVNASTGLDPLLRPPPNTRALAVLPFSFLNLASSEDTDDRFLGIGLADALITRLSKVRRFVVRPTSSISGFGSDVIDPVQAGRDLNVDFILSGSIKKAADRLRVTVQLLNVQQNAAVWATSIDEILSDVFSLEDKLAAKVIEGLLPQLTTDERDELGKRGTDNPEAFEHYLRGRYYFNTFTEDSFAKAFVSFHSAIAADAKYAHAYAGIADYYNWLGILGVLPPQECFPPAIEAAKQAVKLDDSLSEAHASLGFSLHAGNYEWSRAEHHLTRAMELNPSNANAYIWYSIVLFTEGRFSEGLQFARRAVEIDPLTPFSHHNVAWGLYFSRQFEEAAAAYRKVIADFPTYSFGHYGLSKVLRITGDTKGSIRESTRTMELMGNSIFSLLADAECYAADGQVEVARRKLTDLERQSTERYVSPYQLALGYSYLKDYGKALELLVKASEIKEVWLNWMGVDPVFDPIRGHAKFESILEKTGYRPFFNSYSATSVTGANRAIEGDAVHNLTTLVIDEGHVTKESNKQQRRPETLWRFASIAVILLSLATIGLVGYTWYRAAAPAALPARISSSSIVVLPFAAENGSESEIGVGFAHALTNKLGNIKSLQVISGNTGRVLARDGGRELNDSLGIAYAVLGTVANDGPRVSVHSSLVETGSGSILFEETFTAADGDLFEIQTRLAHRIWESLGVSPLPIERQQVEKSYTRNASAYSLYLRGRSEMTVRSVEALQTAAATFSAALQLDPEFALAHVGLADTLALLNLYSISPPPDSYSRAKAHVARALEIDPNLAEAHATAAYIKFFHDRDRTGSELEFRRAIQVNPSYAPAHHWFALTLAARGERVDAETEIEIAKRLDPKAPAIRSAAGVVHYHLGNFDRAIVESDDALALDSRAIPAFKVKRWAYTALGRPAEAREALAKEMDYSGGSLNDPGWLVIALQIDAIDGDRQALLSRLDAAASDPSVRDNPYGLGFEVALAYNALGSPRQALDWLERCEAAGSHSFNFLKMEPRFTDLHRDRRFASLAAKLDPAG
jgi:eukaryotic-like serine/threonine-protein kinase